MASLTPIYSANRSVREYVENAYLPAAASYRRRAQNGAAVGVEISAWWGTFEHGWHTLRFGPKNRYPRRSAPLHRGNRFSARSPRRWFASSCMQTPCGMDLRLVSR